jgi:hypothetical protein
MERRLPHLKRASQAEIEIDVEPACPRAAEVRNAVVFGRALPLVIWLSLQTGARR